MRTCAHTYRCAHAHALRIVIVGLDGTPSVIVPPLSVDDTRFLSPRLRREIAKARAADVAVPAGVLALYTGCERLRRVVDEARAQQVPASVPVTVPTVAQTG